MLVALDVVVAIIGAVLGMPVEIALGVAAMLSGGEIAYVAARGTCPRPQPPGRADS